MRAAERLFGETHAIEWLETVRKCASELDALNGELRMLEAARDECLPWQTKGAPVYVSMGGSCSNPTMTEVLARIDSLDERIIRLRAKTNESERNVGECLKMLDAMRVELGERHADALELYYVDCAETWSEVAWEMGVSRTHLYRLRADAMTWVDAYLVQHGI